jgi:hypothetical protein
MNHLRPLELWDRGFEFHSRHGCLCTFILFIPKRRFTQDLHGATSQKTAFFINIYVSVTPSKNFKAKKVKKKVIPITGREGP